MEMICNGVSPWLIAPSTCDDHSTMNELIAIVLLLLLK